jgi:hypothetical protein
LLADIHDRLVRHVLNPLFQPDGTPAALTSSWQRVAYQSRLARQAV